LIYTCCPKTLLAANRKKKIGGQTLLLRPHPQPSFAAQSVCYATPKRARAGIEREENSYLTSSNKNLGTLLDRLGREFSGATIRGNNVILTLRVRAQELAQKLLHGKCGAAVALNPRTGAVYAMASSPTFDQRLI